LLSISPVTKRLFVTVEILRRNRLIILRNSGAATWALV